MKVETRDFKVKTTLGVTHYKGILGVSVLDEGVVVLEDEKGIAGLVPLHALDSISVEGESE